MNSDHRMKLSVILTLVSARPQEREARRKREEIRMERARERERERRLEARDAHGGKRSKLTRDRDRDIGEKIALGQVRAKHMSSDAQGDRHLHRVPDLNS